MEIPIRYLRDLKFIVVGDAKTGEDLALFFDPHLPDLHRELLAAAREKWLKLGVQILPHGGGRFSLIEDTLVFFGRSGDFGRYEDDVVLKLAAENTFFQKMNWKFLSKAGAESAQIVLRVNRK
jgi:hypothetical protein